MRSDSFPEPRPLEEAERSEALEEKESGRVLASDFLVILGVGATSSRRIRWLDVSEP